VISGSSGSHLRWNFWKALSENFVSDKFSEGGCLPWIHSTGSQAALYSCFSEFYSCVSLIRLYPPFFGRFFSQFSQKLKLWSRFWIA
jgi:hypothetical protein